jgi:hypothetical protein
LEAEIARRKGLEGQILEISDREQQRLAQELHDKGSGRGAPVPNLRQVNIRQGRCLVPAAVREWQVM